MANQKYVDLIKQGTAVWNAWREKHPHARPDLSDANLSGANLRDANLRDANLHYADLRSANLRDANLRNAYPISANLRCANLSGAYLTCANLTCADLGAADLGAADLGAADLGAAYLSGADLRDANLRDADLRGTNLSGANLSGANLSKVQFGWTTFIQIDLSNVKGLETAIHEGPSAVNINTVIFPHDEVTCNAFLRGVGFTETQIEYLPSLLIPQPIAYHSLFISYAHQDGTLANRLYHDLRKKDVPCWFAPHDLRPGDYHHSRIDEAIHHHDRTLLLLSEHAVNSSWVKHEVQVALAREIEQDRTILFPLRLDEAIMHTNKEWAMQLRSNRHIGDFTNWQDETAYQKALDLLLQQIKKPLRKGEGTG